MVRAKDPKSPGAGIITGTGAAARATGKVDPALQAYLDRYPPHKSAVYIGIDAGSDLEKYGIRGAGANQRGAALAAKYGPMKGYYGTTRPLYKVGYQNSKDFSRELGGLDPNVIYLYQQRLNAVGLLDKFTPGKLDPSTRAAFKSLLGTANQSAATWQQTLQDIEGVGGVVGDTTRTRAPFVANPDDPITLRETFQKVAQSIYGGDLPDADVNGMVDAYRNMQVERQQAQYNAEETGGTVTKEVDPQAYVLDRLKAEHPQQLERVKFQDLFSQIVGAFGSSGAGR